MRRTPAVRLRHSFAACLTLLAAWAGVAAAQTVVTTCGQETKGPAVLNADLDCTGFDGNAITMRGGTLTMNGHTITGATAGVWCDLTCKIVGPGTITGSDFVGVQAFGVGLKMSQVNVTNHATFGVQVWDSATIEGPAVFSGNGAAILVGNKAKLKDLTITNNGGGVSAGNNAKTGSISLQGSTVSNNVSGLGAQRSIKILDSAVTDNDRSGVYAAGGFSCEHKAGATLIRSTVTGNGTDAWCGTVGGVCADVATCKIRPRVKAGSACGTSFQIDSGNPGSDWDVCTLD